MLDLQLLNAVNEIAIAAGSEILDVYNSEQAIEVSTKQDNSPLTDADRRAPSFNSRSVKQSYT